MGQAISIPFSSLRDQSGCKRLKKSTNEFPKRDCSARLNQGFKKQCNQVATAYWIGQAISAPAPKIKRLFNEIKKIQNGATNRETLIEWDRQSPSLSPGLRD
jgi:hypothetical protein